MKNLFLPGFLTLILGILGTISAEGQTVFVNDALTVKKKAINVDTIYVYDTLTLKPNGGKLRLSAQHIRIFHGGAVILEADTMAMNLRDGGTVMIMGGLLRMEGNAKQPYVRLNSPALSGSSILSLDSVPAFWSVGDSIVVTPSNENAYDYDTATITGIAGNQISLSAPLSHQHDGGLGIYSAEVMNISRALKISGKNWMVMAMENATVQIRGVEFSGGGQRSVEGFYPMHFHFTGDAADSYVEHCAIHRSQHRGIALHRVNYAKCRFNALHNNWSHGIVVAEDGFSHGLEVTGNIVHFSRSYALDEVAFPQGQLINGRLAGDSGQSEGHAGSYWVTNYCNDVYNNIAAGGEGTNGFYLDGSMGRNMILMASQNKCTGNFNDNIAHSYRSKMLESPAGIFKSYLGHGAGWFQDQFEPDTLVIDNFRAFNCHGGGIWSESMQTTFTNADVRGCHYGILLMKGFVDGAYVDRQSPTTTPSPLPYRDLGALRIDVHEDQVVLSLGPWAFRDVTVRNYEEALLIERDFEGPAYLQNLDFDGPDDKLIKWPNRYRGAIYHYDSGYAIINGEPRVEAFQSVWFDDMDSCTPFEGYPLTYTLQEGWPYWDNCLDYPWLPRSHWVANSHSELSTPPGAEHVRAWGFPGDTAIVDGTAYPVNVYGFEGTAPALAPLLPPDLSNTSLLSCGGAISVTEGLTAFNAIDLSSSGQSSACYAEDVYDIWYKYLPSAGAERIMLRTCGSDAPHSLSIWNACPGDPDAIQLGCTVFDESASCGSIDSATNLISLLMSTADVDTLFIRLGYSGPVSGQLQIVEGNANPCDHTTAPQNLSNEINPYNFVVSRWDPVPWSVACQFRGWAIDTVQEWSWAVNVPELEEVMLGFDLLIPETTYGWQVRCACDLDPIVATPWSDTAYVSTPYYLREGLPVLELDEPVQIWPNPTEDLLQVSGTQALTAFDMQGRIVWVADDADGMHKLDVSDWSPGMYIIQADNSFHHVFIRSRR